MIWRAALLLASFVAAPLPALARQGAVSEIPAAFSECVAEYGAIESLGEPEPFGCTRAYFDSLPGSEGSTLDMASAAGRAAETADFYIDSVLLPSLLSQGQTSVNDEPPRADPGDLARQMLLRSYVRSARAAGETRCDLVYEANSEGTIRSVHAGSCAVENRDRLIGDLINLYGPQAN